MADWLAYMLMVESTRRKYFCTSIAASAADCLFLIMDIVDRAVFAQSVPKWKTRYREYIAGSRNSFTQPDAHRMTHPTPYDRRLVLQDFMKGIVPGAERGKPLPWDNRELQTFRRAITNSLEGLWKDSLPFWRAIRKGNFKIRLIRNWNTDKVLLELGLKPG